jgi:hypothetical protein
MKNLFLFIAVFFTISTFGQKAHASEKDVFTAKEIIFYGYDFSNFKLAEIKRLYDGNLRKTIPAWIEFVNGHNGQEAMQRRLNKHVVTYNFDYTINLIKYLKEENLVVMFKHTIPSDTIQNIINKYNVNEKEGVGFTIIVECFEKVTNESSAYFVFFDIASKKILMLDHYSSDYANGFGMAKYWGVGLNVTIGKYIDKIYKKKLKAFTKQQSQIS